MYHKIITEELVAFLNKLVWVLLRVLRVFTVRLHVMQRTV